MNFQIPYATYVRPLLEYANQVVYPGRTKIVTLIGHVQRAATRLVAGLKSVDYEIRLAMLDLFPLQYRRLRGELILTYTLFEQSLANRFFTVDPANTRRGHIRSQFIMSSVTTAAMSALGILKINPIIEPNGPIFNGPGAEKPKHPFILRTLEFQQRAAIERAKKYAMEQSIRAVLLRQTQAQQSQQLNNIKKNQTVALLNRVYVGSIAYDVKEDSLKQSFSPFGPLKTVSMSWDPATQKHKGFAFLEFEYPEAAQLAIDQMNNASFGGRQLKVGRPSNLTNADTVIAELVAEYKLENRIYVSGIHVDLTEDDISLVFEAFGKIVFCRLVVDPESSERHRGFGYIEYQNAQSAADAVASMNQFNLGGQLLRVCKAISPPEGISSAAATALPPAAAVAAASVTAQLLSMETEQLPVNTNGNTPLGQPSAQPQTENAGGLGAFRVVNSPPSSNRSSGFDVPPPSSTFNGQHPRAYIASPQPLGSWDQPDPSDAGPVLPSSIPLPPENSIGIGRKSSFAVTSTPPPVSGILILRNMVGPEDCDDELEGEVTAECSRYGGVQRVIVHQEPDPSTNTLIVKVFVQFDSVQAVQNAVQALNGRFFAGRQIVAEHYDLHAFTQNDLSR
ncbi:hypothetical protein T265_07497 [Opisthorchis viverrini]|uniref:RRM domain-containing protein n=2 Tax=Opisthorchis viverrini TaxID=6198 RepID=A0A074ZCN4_OPIVI|nr:hypothetical protein T265_07497 [Opisthorchis viverrini]KER24928.1 hypothetical protein T265_07497 [Opisthorchis viverrini]